jgi:hypothetical protein
LAIYQVTIKMIQTSDEVIEVNASNVQQARSRAKARIYSLAFKDLVDTDYLTESIRRTGPSSTSNGPLT